MCVFLFLLCEQVLLGLEMVWVSHAHADHQGGVPVLIAEHSRAVLRQQAAAGQRQVGPLE